MRQSQFMSDKFVNQIFAGFAATRKKQRTANDYFASACLICDFAKKDFLELDTSDAFSYKEYLETCQKPDGSRISNRTIKMRFVGLNQLAKYIVTAYPEEMEENPFRNIVLPNTHESVPVQRIPTMKEIDQLLSAAKEDPQMYLILCLISRMGLTALETVRLKRQQIVEIGEDKIAILCIEKDGKTEKLRPVPEDVKEILLDYMDVKQVESGLFFNEWNKPLTIRNLDYLLKKYSALAGIETKCSVKDLRNRAILSMLQADASPQDVAQYAGIGMVRVRQFVSEGNVLANCPADLVNFRIIKEE